MSKKFFNEFQIKELKENPNVTSASESWISYSPNFKIKTIKQYKHGLPNLISI